MRLTAVYALLAKVSTLEIVPVVLLLLAGAAAFLGLKAPVWTH